MRLSIIGTADTDDDVDETNNDTDGELMVILMIPNRNLYDHNVSSHS